MCATSYTIQQLLAYRHHTHISRKARRALFTFKLWCPSNQLFYLKNAPPTLDTPPHQVSVNNSFHPHAQWSYVSCLVHLSLNGLMLAMRICQLVHQCVQYYSSMTSVPLNYIHSTPLISHTALSTHMHWNGFSTPTLLYDSVTSLLHKFHIAVCAVLLAIKVCKMAYVVSQQMSVDNIQSTHAQFSSETIIPSPCTYTSASHQVHSNCFSQQIFVDNNRSTHAQFSSETIIASPCTYTSATHQDHSTYLPHLLPPGPPLSVNVCDSFHPPPLVTVFSTETAQRVSDLSMNALQNKMNVKTRKSHTQMPKQKKFFKQQVQPSNQSQKKTLKHKNKTTSVHFMSANINSLRGKLNELQLRAAATSPHIIACQETKLGKHITSESLNIPGYLLFRKDRNECGGGVAIFVMESLKPTSLSSGVDNDLELLAVKCKLQNSNFIFATMYRPPRFPSTEFVEKVSNFISSLGTESNSLILTGDTNLCALSSEFNIIQDMCEAMQLKQIVDRPTHSLRLIDQIFIADSVEEFSYGIAPPIEKTHVQLWAKVALTCQLISKETQTCSIKYKLNKADWLSLNISLMKSRILQNVSTAASVNDCAQILQDEISLAMQRYIPKGLVKNKSKTCGWLNASLLQLFWERNKSYRKWKKDPSESNHSRYRQLDKKVKKEIFIAKKTYFHNTFSKCSDPSDFWKALNNFLGRVKTSKIPPLFTATEALAVSSLEKADVLCDQFSSVFTPSSGTYFSHEVNDPLQSIATSAKFFLEKITKLQSKKAMGVDGIPAVVVKNCALVIAPCLVLIADRCLREERFPMVWKEAVVAPVPKVKNSQKPIDYRPISLLPLMSKLVESQLNEVLLNQIDQKLSENQFGFRRGRSTSDAILSLIHYVLKGFEKCESSKAPTNVVGVFFDLSKAFDTVPHANLLKCLHEQFQLPLSLIHLVQSYLEERTMKVKVDECISKSASVSSGVPQGSVLGPTLFIIYINSLAKIALSTGSKIILYADDVALIKPVTDSESLIHLQSDIHLIDDHVGSLGLSLNHKKCKFVQFSLSRARSQRMTLLLSGNTMEQVNSYRYLGVELDERLSFSTHTSKSVLKAKQGIGLVCRSLRKWAPKNILKTAITSIILPALLYAIEVWYPGGDCQQKQIEKLIKYAARLVLNNFRTDISYEALLDDLKWKSLSRVVMERRLLCVKKYLDGTRFTVDGVFSLQPPPTSRFSQRILSQKQRHQYQLALSNSQRNTLERRLAIEKMKELWNALPERVACLPFKAFKNEILSQSLFDHLCSFGVVSPVVHC
jgi:exonuclease III